MTFIVPRVPAYFVPGSMRPEDSMALAELGRLVGRDQYDGHMITCGNAALAIMDWLASGDLRITHAPINPLAHEQSK